MSRVINPDSAGKDRTRLTKAIVLAVRELAKQNEVTEEARDLAAFISLAAVAAITQLGTAINNIYTKISSTLDGAGGGS